MHNRLNRTPACPALVDVGRAAKAALAVRLQLQTGERCFVVVPLPVWFDTLKAAPLAKWVRNDRTYKTGSKSTA